ncbi:hypothetical protein AB0O90_07000 [Microbacterium testaceum]|uniref:hypothetical protein n=1 Tax=Microbacterium testaceum TaxID=2033 RepID=UPI00342659CF
MSDTAEWITATAKEWGMRVQNSSSATVASGSDLDQDTALPGGLTPARLAWRAIGTAGEHLAAMHHMLITSDNGVRAKPYLTLARATMLGAAKAIFVLEPDMALDRRTRSLRLLRAEIEDLHRLVSDWEKSSRAVTDARDAVDDLRRECQQELRNADVKADSVVSETDLLVAVAPHLHGGTRDPLASIMDVWRLSSATAHARTWSWDSGLEDEEPLTQYLRIWSVPVGLLEESWVLWNKRRKP